MAEQSRPLSPHLQVYKPQLTSMLSIAHRGTGIVLSLGFVLLVYWLVAAAAGPAAYAEARELLGSVPGLVVLAACSFSFFYHLGNGVRHLFWDAGYWLQLPQAYAAGYAVLVFAALGTGAFWALVLSAGGAA